MNGGDGKRGVMKGILPVPCRFIKGVERVRKR